MTPTNPMIVAKLAEIAQTVAIGECEAVAHGQPECPEQYPKTQDDWCLPCVARAVLKEYLG